jgi:hypothetical protein
MRTRVPTTAKREDLKQVHVTQMVVLGLVRFIPVSGYHDMLCSPLTVGRLTKSME